MKKIITECCEKIICDEKDLKKGIYKKKGYEFEWNIHSELKFPSFLSWFWKSTQTRESIGRYKLEEDIILKYTICPICGEKVWMNEPFNGRRILEGGWKCIELKRRITKWRDFMQFA